MDLASREITSPIQPSEMTATGARRSGETPALGSLAWAAVAWLALAAAVPAPWMDAPLSGGLRNWIMAPAAAVALVALYGLVARRPDRAAAGAIAGLACCVAWVLHVALQDARFWTLVREHEYVVQAMALSREFLPGVLGREPTLADHLATTGLLDRLAASLYFMGAGWWLGVAGCIVLLAVTRRAVPRAISQWAILAPAAALLAWNLAHLGVATAGDILRVRAQAQMANSQFAAARANFERAILLDPQLAGSADMRMRSGLALHHLGESAAPEALFALARSRLSQGPAQDGLALLTAAGAQSQEPLASLVRAATTDLLIADGLDAARASGFNAASGHWARALAVEPADVRAMLLQAVGDFAQGRHQESLASARALLARSRHARLNAQAYIIIGDNLWKLGERDAARRAYEASARSNDFGNFRSRVSLGGF